MRRTMIAILAACGSSLGWAQQDFSEVEIQTTEVAPGIYMLVGAGGNLGLSVGDDGAFLIDDQFAPLSGKIMAAVAELTDAPVEFLANTHCTAITPAATRLSATPGRSSSPTTTSGYA